MTKPLNIAGKTFNNWKVIKREKNNKHGKTMWLCVCSCGNLKSVCGNNLVGNNTLGCTDCYHNRSKRYKAPFHLETYNSWRSMIHRCNGNHKSYKDYGGRGIKVCERWLNYDYFYEDMGVRPKDKSLGRIDNDKDYHKDNCRWETQKQQQNNRRNNTRISYKGEIYTQSQLSDRLGLNYRETKKFIKEESQCYTLSK